MTRSSTSTRRYAIRPIPGRLRADFDPGDHVHPNDAGNAAMAAAIDVSIFRR